MPSYANPLVLILKNRRERLSINVTSSDDDALTQPTSLRLTVTDLHDAVKHRDAFPTFPLTGTLTVTTASMTVTGTNTDFQVELPAGSTFTLGAETYTVSSVQSSTALTLSAPATVTVTGTATRPSRIINTDPGVFYFEYGDPNAPVNTPNQAETNTPTTRLFVWEVEDAAGDLTVIVQQARIISGRTLSLLPGFRKMIDKSVKIVDQTQDCFLGYDDGQLLQYLEEGLSIINAYQPYPTFCSLDEFPLTYLHVLHGSALIAGVMSQELFAIDTDIPNYADQGNSFVIQHQPQLAAFLQNVTAQMDKLIPLMKLHFVRTGSLHIEAGNNFRLAQLIQSAPNGSLFRNVYFRGS